MNNLCAFPYSKLDNQQHNHFQDTVFQPFNTKGIAFAAVTSNQSIKACHMFKNYLKIALRSFWKQKLTSAINVIGLSIGIACAGLGFVFIEHELSFDKFHNESEHIYWLSGAIKNKVNFSSTPAPLSPALQETFPGVTEAFRMENHEIIVQSGNEFFKEEGHFVDPNFFSFFSFDLLEGAPEQVFNSPNAVVLTEATARKYFGRLSPIGKELRINYRGNEEVLEVSGVAAEAPRNSSLQYDFLLPLAYLYRDDPAQLAGNWGSFAVTSFIRLKSTEDRDILEGELPGFITEQIPDQKEDNQLLFNLRALHDYHLKDQYFANGLTAPADMTYIRILGLIAILILIVAGLNFMNLTNARGSGRLTEVGVRRVMGAERQQVLGQFLSESILMSLLSLGVAVLLIEATLPFVENITGAPISVNWLDPKVFLPLIGIAGTAGVLAGMYPAIVLARLKAVDTFKSSFKTGGNNLVTKGSLIFQFALSVGLISCTLIMYQQQQFIKNRNLGFNQEEIVVIPTQTSYTEAELSQRLVKEFKQDVSNNPAILQVSGVSSSFNRGNSALFIQEEDGSNSSVFFYFVDDDYLPLLDIELVEGRNFSEEVSSATEPSIIVNQAFIDHYGITDPVEDYRLPERFRDLANARILGVVNDYNYLNLKSEIHPLVLRKSETARFGYIMVKVNPAEVDRTLAQLRDSWQKVSPDKPFEFSFLNEDIQQQYLVEARWNKAITAATVLAVVIACLGLFGLIALILAERTKEIGIRKVLGATVPNIAWLISRQFVILLGVAALIAVPLAWWTMQKWLENFVYKIDIHLLVFFGALGITLLLALFTTGLQAARAAVRNPVDALRNE